MKAVVYQRYGGPEVLQLREVDEPAPGDRDVLIRVRSVSLNRSDWEGLVGKPAYARIGGVLRPKHRTPGTDVAGVVEAVGSEVDSFRPGDEVFGDVMYHGGKALAEYLVVPDTAHIVPKPPELSFSDASTIPQAGMIALHATRGRIQPADRVLINGAGGGTGVFAIQMAKQAGADVTGVDNQFKQEFLRSLGVDNVIDYTLADYTRSGSYDLILDLVCERSIFAIRRAVAPGGRYSVVGGNTRALISALTVGTLLSAGDRKMGVLMVQPNRDDLTHLAQLVTAGELDTVIDRTYSLEEVPDALRRLGDGRALGKLVIEIG